MNEKIELTGVPETMLQTLYARAKESRTRGAVTDKKAEEIIEKLDYDFSLADSDIAMSSGVIARTVVLDKMVSGWLTEHPGAVVVNIACGLDTIGRSCDNGSCKIYNLDFPEVIKVRNELLPAGEREENVPCDLNDTAWFERSMHPAALCSSQRACSTTSLKSRFARLCARWRMPSRAAFWCSTPPTKRRSSSC